MKKTITPKKLTLEKFEVSKLEGLHKIYGGNPIGGGNSGAKPCHSETCPPTRNNDIMDEQHNQH